MNSTKSLNIHFPWIYNIQLFLITCSIICLDLQTQQKTNHRHHHQSIRNWAVRFQIAIHLRSHNHYHKQLKFSIRLDHDSEHNIDMIFSSEFGSNDCWSCDTLFVRSVLKLLRPKYSDIELYSNDLIIT